MSKTVKNILKILLIGLITTHRPHHRATFHPGRGADGSGAQCFRTKRHYAAGFYCLWDFRLLPDCLAVPAHPDRMGGNRILQGLKYGLSCCVVWIVYLLEPLPHVAAHGSDYLPGGG